MLFIYEDGIIERVVEMEEWFNVSWIIDHILRRSLILVSVTSLNPSSRREINIFAFPLRRGK
jgi:hypothetical protein